MPTQLELGSGLGSSRMSLECKTERALGLAQAGEPAQLCSAQLCSALPYRLAPFWQLGFILSDRPVPF